MKKFYVSRHPGALEWLGEVAGVDGIPVSHLDLAGVSLGDMVYGTLPVDMVADVCAKGAVYIHIRMNLRSEQRGKELSKQDMYDNGASLICYHVIHSHM